MPDEPHTKREEQEADDRFTRKDSRIYTNFDLLATKDPASGNKVIFVLILALSIMMGAYLISFYV